MILSLSQLFARQHLAPAGDDGSVDDRGDDFVSEEEEAEAKPEAEPEVEAKAEKEEGEEEGEEKPKKRDDRIPVSRHKELLEKERAQRANLEKQLAQYQSGDRIAVINDEITKAETKIGELDEKYDQLIIDGDKAEANKVRKEIRALERELTERKSDLKAQAASARAVEKIRYDMVVERLEAAYPVLNPDQEEFDEEASQDVLDLAETYRIKRQMTPAEALQAAAKKLLGAVSPKQTKATEVTPRVSEKDAQKKVEAERKKDQVEKNLRVAKDQPADTAKLGADTDKAGGGISAKDVLKMSEKDFNKLDAETLARMRGDFIGA